MNGYGFPDGGSPCASPLALLLRLSGFAQALGFQVGHGDLWTTIT